MSSIVFHDDNGEYHSDEGPAITMSNGTKLWYLHGKLHRDDGPACEYANGLRYWYLYGKYYYFEEWFKRLTPKQQYNYFWNLDE
jgi:hypothetical protein